MLDQCFIFLEQLSAILWGQFIGIPLIVILGSYFTVKSRFIQIRGFPLFLRDFFSFLSKDQDKDRGVHPLKLFFASIGGCIGIGNVVGICEAVKWGGPGALFWVWVTGFLGMIIKYCEVYLGVRFRVRNGEQSYDGGPMFFLQRAFKHPLVPLLICLFLCIYGVEVYMFGVMTSSICENWHVEKVWVVIVILLLLFTTVWGGMERVGRVSSFLVPLFITCFSLMSFWVIFKNLDLFPLMLRTVLSSAFSGHAATGGFLGATLSQVISHGVRRGCYSGDVGVGYASIIHSETRETNPCRQAGLAIFGVFLDTFVVCSFSLFLVLLTGVWKEPHEATFFVQKALALYFPYVDIFWPFFLFLLGFSTMTAFFAVGLKAAQFLSPSKGRLLYYIYGFSSLVAFSFLDTSRALLLMELSGACLLVLNLTGIFLLRKEIHFEPSNLRQEKT